ncbi:MAG: AbrB/MazE/SpoVT family DNA-binding domain-containing protein [Burkholderiaceae bacterium]
MQLQIAKWGNSLAMRLPAELVQRLRLKAGDRIDARLAADGSLTIRPAQWDRQAFAAELASARRSLPVSDSVIDTLRNEARY